MIRRPYRCAMNVDTSISTHTSVEYLPCCVFAIHDTAGARSCVFALEDVLRQPYSSHRGLGLRAFEAFFVSR